MFKSKKFRVVFISEMVLPWLVAVFGIPAFFFWQERSSIYYENARQGIYEETESYLQAGAAFDVLYAVAMACGFVAVTALIIMGFVSLVLMIVRLSRTVRPPHAVSRCVVVLLCSGPCVLGTLLLMFILLGMTYGQGV